MRYEKPLLVLSIFVVFSFYFIINRFLAYAKVPAYELATIEPYIPLVSPFLIFYLSYFIFLLIPIFLTYSNRKELRKLAIAYATILIISYIIFLAFPTKIIRPETIEPNGWNISPFNEVLSAIYQNDSPYNAFPSTHVSLSLMAMLICFRYKKRFRRLAHLSIPWFILIALSTLIIKQHYILDVAGGMVLSVIVYYIFYRE
jgi:membrane-associated phospholipid phosphatase